MKISDTERRHIEAVLGDLSPAMKFALINNDLLEALGSGPRGGPAEVPGSFLGGAVSSMPNLVLWGGLEQVEVLMSLVAENGLKLDWQPEGVTGRRADLALFAPGRSDPIYIEIRDEDRPSDGAAFGVA